jgi:2-desacetyl-2-hydroxyethyl bacteriochlorophyllide A dehydrogenase
MKAILYNKKAPNRLVLQEVDIPKPKAKEVLVKVYNTSPNAADYRSMKMGMLPKHKIFGSAISGVVESVGSAVKNFKRGDEVIGDLADFGFGGFAEYIAAPQQALSHKPSDVSFEEAACLPVAATTALHAVRDKGNVQKGQKVLIIGSSGGVGIYAVQLAHHFGGEVTAVCSTRNIQQSVALGADFVIDYTQEDFTRQDKQYDLIIAINGNYALLDCMRKLNKTGTYVAVGGALSQIFKALIFGKLLSLGTKKIGALSSKSNSQDLAFMAQLTAQGVIKPVIEKRFPFHQTVEAMNYLAEGHAQGKVVIDVA